MKPARSKARLAFIRSLPCVISGRTHRIEACHVGHRGMGQKASDFETIPMYALYHQEQHRIGLKAFCRIYQLDIPALLTLLNRKPKITLWEGRYVARWGEHVFALGYVEDGLTKSIGQLKTLIHEHVSQEILARQER